MSTETRTQRNTFPSRQAFLQYCKEHNKAFFDHYKGRYYIQYVRSQWHTVLDEGDTVRGDPTAVFLAYKDDQGKIYYGWSAAQPPRGCVDSPQFKKGDTFNKAIGLWKAIRRATGLESRHRQIPLRLTQRDDTEFSLYETSVIFPEFEKHVEESLQ